MLGKVTDTKNGVVTEKLLQAVAKELEGEYEQEYPPYSSKSVGGKPLFKWAREGRLHRRADGAQEVSHCGVAAGEAEFADLPPQPPAGQVAMASLGSVNV